MSTIKPLTTKRWNAAGLNPAECRTVLGLAGWLAKRPTTTDVDLLYWLNLVAGVIDILTRPRGKPCQAKTQQRISRRIQEAGHSGIKPPASFREFLNRAAVQLIGDALLLLPQRRGRRSQRDGLIGRHLMVWPDPRKVATTALRYKIDLPQRPDAKAIYAALDQHGVRYDPPPAVFNSLRKRFSELKRGRRRF